MRLAGHVTRIEAIRNAVTISVSKDHGWAVKKFLGGHKLRRCGLDTT
jgi:hypothetical protein